MLEKYSEIFENDEYLKNKYLVKIDDEFKRKFLKRVKKDHHYIPFYQMYPKYLYREIIDNEINKYDFYDNDESLGGNNLDYYQFFIDYCDTILVIDSKINHVINSKGDSPRYKDCDGTKCWKHNDYASILVWCESCAGQLPKIKFFNEILQFEDFINNSTFFDDFHMICIKKCFYEDHISRGDYFSNKNRN